MTLYAPTRRGGRSRQGPAWQLYSPPSYLMPPGMLLGMPVAIYPIYTIYLGIPITFEEPKERPASWGGRSLSADVFISPRAPRVPAADLVWVRARVSLSLPPSWVAPVRENRPMIDLERVQCSKFLYSRGDDFYISDFMSFLSAFSAFRCSIYKGLYRKKKICRENIYVSHGKIASANLDRTVGEERRENAQFLNSWHFNFAAAAVIGVISLFCVIV